MDSFDTTSRLEPPARYTRKQFAAIISRSSSTVKRLEKQGYITGKRSASGAVYYTEEDVNRYFFPQAQSQSQSNTGAKS